MHYIIVECDHLVIACLNSSYKNYVGRGIFDEFDELLCFTSNCMVLFIYLFIYLYFKYCATWQVDRGDLQQSVTILINYNLK